MNLLVKILFICFLHNEINGTPISRTDQPTPNQTKPYENPKLFEGDMLFPSGSGLEGRGVALRGASVPWTNGIVPYIISPGYASTEESFIIATMQKMERLIAVNNYKCIQFRPKTASDIYYITIVNGIGCSSYVGQNTGVNMVRTVTLQHPGCIDEGRIMHELLHALGFYHEQSRPDRDNYVSINYANIQSGTESNFDKYSNAVVDTQNTPYDYKSVMHYETDAFSKNGLPTIQTLVANISIGQRDNMSTIDIEEVRLFYNCSARGVTLPPIPTTTTANLYVRNTTISSSLTRNNPTFARFNGSGSNYYYDQYSIIVPATGSYVFMSSGSINTYAQFYGPRPGYLNYFLISYDDNSAGNNQFKIQMYLQASTQYYIIVSTYNSNETGNYTLIASGLNSVIIQQILPATTVATTTPSTTRTTSTTTTTKTTSTSTSTTTKTTSTATTTTATTATTTTATTATTTTATTTTTVTTPPQGCFSPDSWIELYDGQKKSIDELRSYDTLITSDGTNLIKTEMIMMLDKNNYTKTMFYTLHTESNHSISLTALHLIAVISIKGIFEYIPAKKVIVGDYLFVISSDKKLTQSKIIRIEIEYKIGFYGPLTTSGTIMPNNVLVSCFANIYNHQLGQFAMTPVRFYHQLSKYMPMLKELNQDRNENVHWIPEAMFDFTKQYFPSLLQLS
ncbi:hypothetical protein I4U23_011315 [Adineta vaga]|nr:hypothetical protein I4U23_011315 [Adineta vaga]